MICFSVDQLIVAFLLGFALASALNVAAGKFVIEVNFYRE